THSPLMLSRENAADTVVVRKTPEDGVTTKKPMRQAVKEAFDNAQSQSRTLFQLGNLADIYFADLIVLCEGKTDKRLLPLAYERLYGRSPDLDHIVFVSIGSCADISKALVALETMAISACAVADLDFAYFHARRGKLLPVDGSDLAEAKTILTRLQPDAGFTLNGDGLPKTDKQAGWDAADAWAHFASDTEGSRNVERCHEALKDKKVWIWRTGCIEQ